MARSRKHKNPDCVRCENSISPLYGVATCPNCETELCVEFCIPNGNHTSCLACEELACEEEEYEDED